MAIIDNKYEKNLVKRLKNKKVTYISSIRCSDISPPFRHKYYVKNKLENEYLFLDNCLNSRVLRIPNLISFVRGGFYHQLSENIKKNRIVFDLSKKSSFNILPPMALNNVVANFASTNFAVENVIASNNLTVGEISDYLQNKFRINVTSFGDKLEKTEFNQKYHQIKIDMPKIEILKKIEEELNK